MPFTDPRMQEHAESLRQKPAFKFGKDLPSAEDLDKVAEEAEAKAATKPKRKIIAQG